MNEIETILERSPGLTPMGLKVAVGPQLFQERDLALMVRDGRLRAEPCAKSQITRYYLARSVGATAKHSG